MAEQGNNVQWRLASIEKQVEALGQVEAKRTELLTELKLEVRELKKDVGQILRTEQRRDDVEQRSREQASRDRKADRKWQLTVMAAWASAIIAAIAIIIPLLVS